MTEQPLKLVKYKTYSIKSIQVEAIPIEEITFSINNEYKLLSSTDTPDRIRA
jgi:hypothetical protein